MSCLSMMSEFWLCNKGSLRQLCETTSGWPEAESLQQQWRTKSFWGSGGVQTGASQPNSHTFNWYYYRVNMDWAKKKKNITEMVEIFLWRRQRENATDFKNRYTIIIVFQKQDCFKCWCFVSASIQNPLIHPLICHSQ